MKTTYTTEMCGDKFELTADFAQASCPVSGDEHGRQVADFRHSPKAAMRAQLEEYMVMSGESRDEDGEFEDSTVDEKIEAALDEMIGRDEDLIEMAAMLRGHGERFAGNNVDDEAQDWLDHGFTDQAAGEWCEIGCWNAATAAELRDGGLDAQQALNASHQLIDAEKEAWEEEDAQAMADDATLPDHESEYTDGDPIYSACNGDTDTFEIIDAAE